MKTLTDLEQMQQSIQQAITYLDWAQSHLAKAEALAETATTGQLRENTIVDLVNARIGVATARKPLATVREMVFNEHDSAY